MSSTCVRRCMGLPHLLAWLPGAGAHTVPPTRQSKAAAVGEECLLECALEAAALCAGGSAPSSAGCASPQPRMPLTSTLPFSVSPSSFQNRSISSSSPAQRHQRVAQVHAASDRVAELRSQLARPPPQAAAAAAASASSKGHSPLSDCTVLPQSVAGAKNGRSHLYSDACRPLLAPTTRSTPTTKHVGSTMRRRTLHSDVRRLLVVRGDHLHAELLRPLSVLPVVGAGSGGHGAQRVPPVAHLRRADGQSGGGGGSAGWRVVRP